jgi:hypothetical protein
VSNTNVRLRCANACTCVSLGAIVWTGDFRCIVLGHKVDHHVDGFVVQPTLTAVSKTKPASMVQEAYALNQRHFGENYVQELVQKAPLLPADIQWHFIGHLQSNKCKTLLEVPNVWMVESVDTEKLARQLEKACVALGRPDRLRVLIQVNTSQEPCTPRPPPLFSIPPRLIYASFSQDIGVVHHSMHSYAFDRPRVQQNRAVSPQMQLALRSLSRNTARICN